MHQHSTRKEALPNRNPSKSLPHTVETKVNASPQNLRAYLAPGKSGAMTLIALTMAKQTLLNVLRFRNARCKQHVHGRSHAMNTYQRDTKTDGLNSS